MFPLHGDVQLLLQPAEGCTEYAHWRDLITALVENLHRQMLPVAEEVAVGGRRAREGLGAEEGTSLSRRLRVDDRALVLDTRCSGRRAALRCLTRGQYQLGVSLQCDGGGGG